MKWNNLKNNKCPKCFGNLSRDVKNKMHECLNCNDFRITEQRFDELVNDMYRPSKKRWQEEDRMSELNNLGREEVAEDFSDSPFLDK